MGVRLGAGARYRVWPKSKLVSMIVSEKALFAGHRFRLALYRGLRDEPSRYPVGLQFARGNMLLAAVRVRCKRCTHAPPRQRRPAPKQTANVQPTWALCVCVRMCVCVCVCVRVCVYG